MINTLILLFIIVLMLILSFKSKTIFKGNLNNIKVKNCKKYILNEHCYLSNTCPERSRYTIKGNGVVHVNSSDLLKSCSVRQQLKHKIKIKNS